jgi:hypothetical protein
VFVLTVHPTSGVRQAYTVPPLPTSGLFFREKKEFFHFFSKKIKKKFKKKWPDVRPDERLTSGVRRQPYPT